MLHITRLIIFPLAAAIVLCGALSPAYPAGDDFLERYTATNRFRLGRPSAIFPAPDGEAVLFLRSGPRSFVRDLYELDMASGEERVLLSAEDILQGAEEELTAEELARRERMRSTARGIASFSISQDGKRILVPLSGRLFVVERASGEVTELNSEAGYPIDARFSPDGKSVSCVRDGELYILDVASGEERRLTSGAGGTISHGAAEFAAQEEMGRYRGYWWSPDSGSIVYQRTDTTGMESMHILDASRPELPPTSWPYPRAGKRNASVSLGIIPAQGGETTWIEWDREGYEYLARVVWSENGPLTILVQNRRQTEQRLLAVDPDSGSTSTLLVERDDAWVEIDTKMPHWLPDDRGFLWTTDSGGSRTLELRDRKGALVRILAGASLGFREFEHYFPASGDLIVQAGLKPTASRIYRVPLDPARGEPMLLSRGDGEHTVSSPAPGPLYIQISENLAGERSYEVFGERGATGRTLLSTAESSGPPPHVELVEIGNDPSFHAAIVRPRDFDVERRYPVIVHVYGGPGARMVRASSSRYLLDQWMADHGFVVVKIDGRGTPDRGREWSRAIKNDLIKVALEDHIGALRLLGERYAELDLSRVGIHGWSFGGYFTAMAVSRHPELFRAGVAVAPVADWLDYDTHYTERYMGLPEENPDGYAAANVLTYADRLSRPLLIIHGTADDNVYFMHSLKLADALLRAGKSFEFLPLPGMTHIVPDPVITEQLYTWMMEYLERHLMQQ
jgi:dipeptidyl-peptidase-4